MQIMQILTINVNKKKSSSRSYIFHCSEEWKYKFYIFTSENITFSKYAFYFINNSLYVITLYIIKDFTVCIFKTFSDPECSENSIPVMFILKFEQTCSTTDKRSIMTGSLKAV